MAENRRTQTREEESLKMANEAARLAGVVRGDIVESAHRGHVAIWHRDEGLVAGWGDPGKRILPRSAIKMIQALPLVESGAADAAGLSPAQLALACASHRGTALHTGMVETWLASIDRTEADLRCGAHWPYDKAAENDLICAGATPGQRHNNCSGKHTGFLTLTRHLGAGPEYLEIDHPVQRAVRDALAEVSGEAIGDYAIDGCSAPNFAVSLSGFARALADFACAGDVGGVRGAAMGRLVQAMTTHPECVSGDGGACTRLMRAMGGRAAIKTGAEGVFAAIIPERRLGIAVKIEDGATRASEAVITRLLIGAGVLDPAHPEAVAFSHGPIRNWRGIETGHVEVAEDIRAWGA
jgi:L-asparaginase II